MKIVDRDHGDVTVADACARGRSPAPDCFIGRKRGRASSPRLVYPLAPRQLEGTDRVLRRYAVLESAMTPAAALRAMRPVRSYTCAQCGCGFTASDERARYCSNRCRQAAKYQRVKAAKSQSSGSKG